MVNDRSASAQMKKNNRAEEWLKNAVKDKHVRLIPFSEISKVKYNVAKGGSGTIHLGAWRNMHVAIKEQHNTHDLIKELKMHKQVHDSNYIVKFFGITKHPLTHDTCIVMQYAENGCLQDYLETRNVSITWLTKYRLAWEVASGLDFIHRENIFHTDLHSRNILIDTGGKALITDFGLSKSVNKTIYTTKAGLFGVVPYVAPERMQNPTITYNAKCDIYSLGVILWELSSCVIPFEAQLQDVMLAVNIIAGVREKTVPGTAVEYEMLYRRCWDGLPQNRPQMEIVLSELVELLAAEQHNPRSAEARPRSPRSSRPLSSDSMIAPSMYDTDAATPSSPENTHHMRPASPPTILRPGVRQSFGQGAALVQQNVPSVPIRQDRSGVRVSFLGEPVKDTANGVSKASTGQGDAVKNGHAKPTLNLDKSTYNATNGQPNSPVSGLDSPTILDTIPSRTTIAATIEDSTDPPTFKDQNQDDVAVADDKLLPMLTDGSNEPDSPTSGMQFLPPLPSFNALSISPSTSPSNDGVLTTQTPGDPSMNKLPETAALALSNGISMISVVSKLNLGSIRNIPTISPPPHGAPPPPPPGAIAGHTNSPRVISPSTTSRPKTVSPPKTRAHRASKSIPPPSGPPPSGPPPSGPPPSGPPPRPSPSPMLGPIPKPPSGPPPTPSRSPTPVDNGPPSGTSGSSAAAGSKTPVSPIQYVPSTTYSPTKGKMVIDNTKPSVSGESEHSPTLSDTTRPTPARQIPMGFPVVTPMGPSHWSKKSTPHGTDQGSTSSPPPSSPSTEGSPSGSPSSTNSTAPSSIGTSPSSNRRDFRPISFLTQQKHSELIDVGGKSDQSSQPDQQQAAKKPADAYVPNPNNNIVPPSQLHMQRAPSPDLNRNNNRHSRVLGSPSLRPAPSPVTDGPNKKIGSSPHLSPAGARPGSPAFSLPSPATGPSTPRNVFPVVEGSIWPPPKSPSRRASEDYDADMRLSEQRETRPQFPSKESSSSTTTPASTSNMGQSPLTSASTQAPVTPPKPRVQLDNFYSLADPYKDLNQYEPTDFFTAVTQSDIPAIERMLKTFPHLIHDSNGFWPHPTPILVAARSRNAIETMKVLIKYGAALDRGDHNGTTVIHFICEQYPDPVEAIQFLTRAGADCNSRDAKKRTPLMVLLQNTHVASTKVLIDAMRCLFKFGAQTKVMDHHYQRTPLHYAILYSKDPAPVMELLLKKGADVNARDWRKSTSLHLILERMDNEEIVQMLLLYGADPGMKNGSKRNALGVAAENLRVMSAWFLLENDLLSSAPESIKKASELCSKADGPDKSAKPLFKNTLSDWQGKDGKVRRIQLAQDCVLRVQRTPDMKTIDQTQVALEFLESVGQPIHMNPAGNGASPTASSNTSHK